VSVGAKPPAGFYVLAFVALSLSVAALVLSIQDDDAAIAAAAGAIAALGCVGCFRMLKGKR
jgi:hypothetical protein